MQHLSRCLISLTLVLVAPFAHADAPFRFTDTPGQLPKDVVPREYALQIAPDIAGHSFRASQTIRIEVLRPTSQIVMNALNLEIDSATLQGAGRAPVHLDAPRMDADKQTLAFALPAPLAPGLYTLAMAWRGRINSVPEGLYLDSYPTPGGDKQVLATMMEPTGARRLLPCWDEPVFRAAFRLQVDLPAGYAAYSNTPVAKTARLADGGQRVAFAATPKMASYLLAFVAGDMERLESVAEGTRIGIVTTRGKQGSAQYALDATARLLRYYNGYFGIRYPLPKLDQIAVPGGFQGAMENWGAIVYNEPTLLVDPGLSPESTRQRVQGMVAHETAHQWFGNLVTMAWWDNLWLNEGFAQWMGTKASDHLHPEWHVWLEAIGGRERAMELDARKTTHPVQQPVATEAQANDAFDEITYDKGSGFLRMLEAYLGEAPFRDGIRLYMARHRYSNTTTADLWDALGKASGKPVARIAADWTTQPGFPLIEVDARCEAGRRHILLRQERFQPADEPAGDALWSVPVQIGDAAAGAGDYTLLQARTAELVQPRCDGALLVDPGNVGFYRVRYAPALLDALTALWPKLPDGARLKLLADSSALVRTDRLPLADYFSLLRGLGAEPRLAVWQQVLDDIWRFDRLALNEPSRAPLHRFAADLIGPRFALLGWDERVGESAEDRLLRGKLAQALSDYDDAAVIDAGRARFARFVADPTSLPASLADAVMGIAGRHADQATYDLLKGLADRASATEEKFRYYRAIGDALDPALAAQALRLAGASEVPQIMRNRVVADVAGSGHLDIAWAYAREHADALLADMTPGFGNRYFSGVVESSARAADADELEDFVRTRLPDGLADAQRTGDEIRTRAQLKARLLPQLESALAGWQPGGLR